MNTHTLFYATNRNHIGKDQWHPTSYGTKFSDDGVENLRFGKLTVNAADAKIEQAARTGGGIDTAAYGALKRAITSKGNSVVLHEFYFDGMTPKAPDPRPGIRGAIERRFESLEKWADDFQASAKAAAGWAMLVKHPVNNKLYNVISDEHAMGVLWMSTPLIVVDTYEHAFYIDYHNKKAEYVEKFLDHIDWAEADLRLESVG